MSTHFGSVFLGDVQRVRLLSTPPSSPPPRQSSTAMHNFFPKPPVQSPETTQPSTSVIEPILALELRLRWLEAILLGVRQDAKDRKGKEKVSELKNGETLMRLAEDIQRSLDSVVESNEGLKRFMDHYDQHAHLLTPSFALSGSLSGSPPSYENMSPSELEAFLLEMEPDIRAADRDMREIDILEKKGVTGPGKLPDYEGLRTRLDSLLKAHKEDRRIATSLEKRIAGLMERHATHVDALSELFVSWDDTITEAEDKVAKLERERDAKRRMGLE